MKDVSAILTTNNPLFFWINYVSFVILALGYEARRGIAMIVLEFNKCFPHNSTFAAKKLGFQESVLFNGAK